MQPPSNRFIDVANTHVRDELDPLSLGYCQQCSTIQLVERMPIDVVRPRYDWLTYNEPEGHLDDVAEKLKKLPGIDSNSRMLGTTYKDQSTLDRMAKLGITPGKCIQEDDFDGLEHPFGLETIQRSLCDSQTMDSLKSRYGSIDLLIVRHIIEHAISAKKLLTKMSQLLTPEGYMVLEMPDSAHIFHADNHAFIWEEHISYFTEESIHKLAAHAGAEVVWVNRYSYPYEDSLVFVLKFTGETNKQVLVEDEIRATSKRLESFADTLAKKHDYWHKTLTTYKKEGNPVAIFGGGHLAAKFINFLQLGDLIDCVIDDHPKKSGLVMPGSRLPIVPSSELQTRGIQTCISTLSPESEVKVRNKLKDYFSSGGVFLPAFAAQ